MGKKKENSFENIEQEVAYLRRQNASLRGLNASLKQKLERKKMLDKEGDELNELRIAEIEGLRSTVEERDKLIKGLQSQTLELNERINRQALIIDELKGDKSVAEANLEHYMKLPWYKKIFK